MCEQYLKYDCMVSGYRNSLQVCLWILEFYSWVVFWQVLGEYNKSVICFENTLKIQPDFDAAAKRKHAVLCHAKLESALEAQHRYNLCLMWEGMRSCWMFLLYLIYLYEIFVPLGGITRFFSEILVNVLIDKCYNWELIGPLIHTYIHSIRFNLHLWFQELVKCVQPVCLNSWVKCWKLRCSKLSLYEYYVLYIYIKLLVLKLL